MFIISGVGYRKQSMVKKTDQSAQEASNVSESNRPNVRMQVFKLKILVIAIKGQFTAMRQIFAAYKMFQLKCIDQKKSW